MRSKPGDIERIRHMIEAIDRIEAFNEGISLAAFMEEEVVQYAVIKNFEIIGEASYHLSKELKESHEQVEWRKIEGLRHILVHDYYKINSELLWNTKEEKLVDLKIELEGILATE